MLVIEKIKELVRKEVKEQEKYLKILELQEKKYNLNLTDEKAETQKSIDYYNKILKEV